MNMTLFFRYWLEMSMMYLVVALSILPVWQKLKNPKKSVIWGVGYATIATGLSTLFCAAVRCPSNWPLLLMLSWGGVLYRRALGPEVSIGQMLVTYMSALAMTMVAVLVSICLNARQELQNPWSVHMPMTSLIMLGVGVVLFVVYALTAARWVRWLLKECPMESVWRMLATIPTAYTLIMMLIMSQEAATMLVNRVQTLTILLQAVALTVLMLFIYLFYRIAQELLRNDALNQENQLLAMESRQYMRLHEYMQETRQLRHDFRQHLHVLTRLCEGGKVEEMRTYLRQYDTQTIEKTVMMCQNPALDALVGFYAESAEARDIPVTWQFALPEKLPLPEAELCMLLGNLLENALRASLQLPKEKRQVRVMGQMLSPAMLGLVVENQYDGKLHYEGKQLQSTSHEGEGLGLRSVEMVAKKYQGQMTVETENHLFRVNVLLNV